MDENGGKGGKNHKTKVKEISKMARPVTLFTGQWADLSLTELAPLAKNMGFDGLELACWGDHFDVYKAAESSDYCRERWRILTDAGLSCICYCEPSRRTGDLR